MRVTTIFVSPELGYMYFNGYVVFVSRNFYYQTQAKLFINSSRSSLERRDVSAKHV